MYCRNLKTKLLGAVWSYITVFTQRNALSMSSSLLRQLLAWLSPLIRKKRHCHESMRTSHLVCSVWPSVWWCSPCKLRVPNINHNYGQRYQSLLWAEISITIMGRDGQLSCIQDCVLAVSIWIKIYCMFTCMFLIWHWSPICVWRSLWESQALLYVMFKLHQMSQWFEIEFTKCMQFYFCEYHEWEF